MARIRSLGSVGATLALSLVIAACGSSKSSSSTSASGGGKSTGKGGTATLVVGTAPQSLDPSLDFTTQGAEVHWLTHLGLYTFSHASGPASYQLIPAIAQGFPTVSGGGKTYTVKIRSGLKYSDGSPVKASDLPFGIERALKLGWSAASFVTSTIAGAKDYSAGKAKAISGITADDATGTITFTLTRPYGAFVDVLAVPGVSLMPQTTPMKGAPSNPPPGFGPYVIKNVVPNVSYDIDINPNYAAQAIPGIPAGKVNVHAKIESNTTTEASDVLNNNADIFDWGDTIPPALISQVQAASGRFKKWETGKTFYFFMNVTNKPFSSKLAREAVIKALDYSALARLGSGTLAPGCYLLPPGMVGHPTAPCPLRDPSTPPDIAGAKQLVQQSGMAGTAVTVWAENRQPRLQWTENLAATLNQIGFKATLKTIADTNYFTTIEALKNHPQTGFADWQQDYPNPTDFYQNLIDGNAILPQGNSNYGEVNDPHIQSETKALYPVPASQLQSVTGRWTALDQYVAQQAYMAVYGYLSTPQFYSNKIDISSTAFSLLYGTDFSTLALK
jgi:peptide/nickel transport system substrate-binding protein